jgi:hypothetical protein
VYGAIPPEASVEIDPLQTPKQEALVTPLVALSGCGWVIVVE